MSAQRNSGLRFWQPTRLICEPEGAKSITSRSKERNARTPSVRLPFERQHGGRIAVCEFIARPRVVLAVDSGRRHRKSAADADSYARQN